MGNSIIKWIEQWLKDRRQRVVVDGEVSSWKSVLSGVPQGSGLWPILFLVYINDLEEGVTGKILKFADDTKLFRKVKEIGDEQNLQDDIDKLVKWSEKWQMLFNFGKCKCLHTGSGNTGVNYEMGGTILSKPVKQCLSQDLDFFPKKELLKKIRELFAKEGSYPSTTKLHDKARIQVRNLYITCTEYTKQNIVPL